MGAATIKRLELDKKMGLTLKWLMLQGKQASALDPE